MTAREQLVRRWQTRLDENQALLEGSSPRSRWLRRLYVRVYRFLLSCYAAGDWQADTPDRTATDVEAAVGPPKSRMELTDLRADTEGAPRSCRHVASRSRASQSRDQGASRRSRKE